MADYHGSMNAKNYQEWLEKLLDVLRAKYPADEYYVQLVLDNAAYHVAKIDGQYSISELTTKLKLVDAILKMNKRGYTKEELMQKKTTQIPGFTNKDLRTILKEDGYAPERFIDQLALKHDIDLCFLPPYHPDLNPIEVAWALAKNYVARHNTTRKFDDVKKWLLEGFSTVTPEIWSKLVDKVKRTEDKSWTADQDEIIINIDEDDDEDGAKGHSGRSFSRDAWLDLLLDDQLVQDDGPSQSPDSRPISVEDDEEEDDAGGEGGDEAEMEEEDRELLEYFAQEAAMWDRMQEQRKARPGILEQYKLYDDK